MNNITKQTSQSSDTPETDAFVDALNDDWDVEFAQLTAHAKKLESERDEAREDALAAQFERDQWRLRCAELQNGVVTEAAK